MTKRKLSTFEREMKDKDFKKKFKDAYDKFLLSELIISLMEEDHQSVRQLAKEVNLSPTVIQDLRSGNQKDIKLTNFINIMLACGYHLVLEGDKKRIRIS
jgi:DNA-binding Xre family transcriptional regulator